MAGNSALARVLSFRRSLPQAERATIDATAEIDPATDAALPPASMPFPAVESIAAEEAAIAEQATPPALTVELPSLSQVTLVPAESQALTPFDEARQAVTVDAIGAIEADIASLLSSMSELSDGRPAAAPADAVSFGEDDEGGDATLTLLSELDRLWRTDPMIGTTHQS